MLLDTFKHKGMRKQMIDKLKEGGISNEEVLRVMSEVPRHWFLETALLDFAYGNMPFPNRAFLGVLPSMEVARILSLLDIQAFQKVLEVGIGTGYNSVLMSKLKAKVFALEGDRTNFTNAGLLFQQLDKKIKLFYKSDFQNGLEEHAPYDQIIVMQPLSEESEKLRDQLAIDGKLLFRCKVEKEVKLVLVTRTTENRFVTSELL